MANIAIIFAGGTGQRMNSRSKPKQFLELHGKPILVYTLEKFQYHPEIDGIVLVTLTDWIEYCEHLKTKYQLTKLRAVISGGASATESAYNGLVKAGELYPKDSIVLIHDGVRPLIEEETISKDIACVKEFGNAITVSPAIETITLFSEECNNVDNKEVTQVIERSKCLMARAPQCFYLKDILSVYNKSLENGDKAFIDSATMMMNYGHKLYTVEGKPENIKITTPNDFFMFKAIMDARENTQIFGV